MEPEVRQIPATIHGRILVRAVDAPAGLLAGFHGYMENAAIQMDRLAALPGAGRWTLLSIQGLHRFYRGRSETVVASWMTREDREAMIADNLRYVDTALESAKPQPGAPIVFAGFSQGVAMAFRAAVRGRHEAAGVIAVGGEIPPELAADGGTRFPPALLVRGERDEWYSQSRLDADAALLSARGSTPTCLVFDGAHEWTAEVSRAAGAFLEQILRR